MKINVDEAGNILSAGTGTGFQGKDYNGELPEDFINTFSLGKYTYDHSTKTIVEDLDFVMPEVVVPII